MRTKHADKDSTFKFTRGGDRKLLDAAEHTIELSEAATDSGTFTAVA